MEKRLSVGSLAGGFNNDGASDGQGAFLFMFKTDILRLRKGFHDGIGKSVTER
jgi:hypothetical protein